MIDKLNSGVNVLSAKNQTNIQQKQEKITYSQPVQTQNEIKVPAETYRAYSGVSFKGKQDNSASVDIAELRETSYKGIENSAPADTATVAEAVEILKPLNLNEKKLLDYLLACSFDSHDETVTINKQALYYIMLLHGKFRDVPAAKIPNVIASSLDNENKCFSDNKFNSLFDATGRLRLSKRNSLKRPREDNYTNARKLALIHKSKLTNALAEVLKEKPIQKEYIFNPEDIFDIDIKKEKQQLLDSVNILTAEGKMPEELGHNIKSALEKNNFDIKGVFSNYYSLLNECKTLDEVKELYPEIEIPDLNLANNGYERVLKSRLAREDMDKIGLEILKKLYIDLKPTANIVVDLDNSYPTTYQSMIKTGISFGKVNADVGAIFDKTDRLKEQFKGIDSLKDKELEFLIRKNATKESRIWAEYMGITNKFWHPVRAIMHKQKHPVTTYYQTDKLVNGYLFYLYKYQNKAIPSQNPLEQYADGKPFNREKKAALEKIYFLYRNNYNPEAKSADFKEFKKNFDAEAMEKSLTKLENHYKNTFANWFMTPQRRENYEKALENSYRLVLEKMDIYEQSHKKPDINVSAVIEDKLSNEELIDYIADTEADETQEIQNDFKRLRNIVYATNNYDLINIFNSYVGSNSAGIDCENYLNYKPLLESCIENGEVTDTNKLIAMFKLHDAYMNYLFSTPDSVLSFEDYKNKVVENHTKTDGTIDYTEIINETKLEEEYLLNTNNPDSEEKSQFIELLNEKFIANGKEDFKSALALITMYNNLPEMFKNKFYTLASSSNRIPDEPFVRQLTTMYEKIASWKLDEEEIITMDADKIPQKVVITSKAKYELLEDCNGNIERFDTILNKFCSAAQKRIGNRQGQGVKMLSDNVEYAAEIKIQGSQAIGSKRLYAREATKEDIEQYGNVKYVFDTLDKHL